MNKNTIKHFTDLLVWQKSHQLFIDMYNKIDELPKRIAAKIIADQIFRSCGSISANIAEGFNARTTKEYVHFLDIAQRSAAETENWFYKIRDCKLIQKETVEEWLVVCIEIEKMLQSLKKKLQHT
ncbi:MAG: four helix bundle protein [candidate division WOR-3 bacterium]